MLVYECVRVWRLLHTTIPLTGQKRFWGGPYTSKQVDCAPSGPYDLGFTVLADTRLQGVGLGGGSRPPEESGSHDHAG